MHTADSSGTAQLGRPLRILVVDDDALGRSLMDVMLSPHGYELDFASDGKEALEAIKTQSYDLVFMDLVLPDMNGRDVCRKVREREGGRRHLPIVAVTAYDVPGQPAELVKAGMDDYIFKPYDLRGLMRIIQLYAVGDGKPGSGKSEQLIHVAAAPVLDTQGTLEDLSGDVAAYQELLRDFLNSLPLRLMKMRQAHAAWDYDRLGREAHSLKGISAGLGAGRLSRLAGQLSQSCRDGQRAPAADLLGKIEQSMAELRAEAQAFLASTPVQPDSAAK